MKAGLSSIQQTLTPEAAAVLNRSIAEAGRRRHGQTSPLHVAATLLATPSCQLRQACLRSYLTASSHPLHTRALDLCFSVALDRLPTTTTAPPGDPPLSNALMAALKRAQAHQRRGSPEQQQQPILAVKVELDQLVISILDDPGVSRVMREASFSSPVVKATIEKSLSSSSSSSPTSPLPSAATRNLYMNPRLAGGDPQRNDDVKRVMEILSRSQKRNPILVGDSDTDSVMREVLQRIAERSPRTQVISLSKEFASIDRSQIASKIKELGSLLDTRIAGGRGVVLDLGDLKWVVEAPMGACSIQQHVISETGRAVVAEMGRVLGSLREAGGGFGRLWVIGTATCATYLRCQVYHPTMERDWDLQAVPIAPRAPAHSVFPRLGVNGILSSSIESLAPSKGFPIIPLRRPPERTESSQKTTLCSHCTESYELELAKLVEEFHKSAKLVEMEFHKSASDSRAESPQALPHWLQMATLGSLKSTANQLQTKEQELMLKQLTDELLKKWRDTCSCLHPNERPLLSALPMPSFLNTSSFTHQTLQPRSTITQSMPALLSNNHLDPALSSMEHPTTPPRSPVKTDLVLGQPKKVLDALSMERSHSERIKDLPGCMQDTSPDQQTQKNTGNVDSDTLKRLFKGLTDKVSWQPEAASSVAAAVTHCRSSHGKPKSYAWLLFIGPDIVGKRKMASALSELVFDRGPVTIHVGTDDGKPDDVNARGKTPVDRVAEAIRQNPFSVVVLEDVDRADALVLESIKQAMERGRLVDSQGREVSLGSAIFVLTAQDSIQREEKMVNSGSQLVLSVEKNGKRRADQWLVKEDQSKKPRKDSSWLSLDLNLAIGGDDEGSRNSSAVTVEHEPEYGKLAIEHLVDTTLSSELIESVDETIAFKPVDFSPLRRRISDFIATRFTAIMGSGQSIRVDEEALDQLVGGVWLGGEPAMFEDWGERVLAPSIEQLRSYLEVGDEARLSSVSRGGRRRRSSRAENWLPSTVTVAGL